MRWQHMVILLILSALMAVRVASTHDIFSATYDEGFHISAGLQWWQTGEYSYDPKQPPLARMAVSFLPYLSGVRTRPEMPLYEQARYTLEEAGSYWKTLTLARLGNLVFVPILIVYVYRWSTGLYGAPAGLIAVLLATFSPNILAHAGIATVDFGLSATFIGAAYHLYRWAEDPRFRNLVWAACLLAVALLCKYSVIGFMPPLLIAYFAIAQRDKLFNRQRWNLIAPRKIVFHGIAFCGIAAFLVWMCFRFHVAPLSDPKAIVSETVDRWVPPGSDLNRPVHAVIEKAPLPAPSFFDGLAIAVRLGRKGAAGQYLLGQVKHQEGWWYYFPVALAVKTTIPLLLLLAVAAAAFFARGRASRKDGSVYCALGAAAIVLVPMMGNLNGGVRHVLAMYPFLAILASSVFRDLAGRSWWKSPLPAIGCLLVVLHGVASLAAHPDQLAYFNEIARGREHKVLGDSNLDWGQDLARLGRYLEANGIEKIYLRYFGTTSPEVVGIRNFERLEPMDRPRGWVAASVTLLQGRYRLPGRPGFEWLLEFTPREKIGKSIWLYYFEE